MEASPLSGRTKTFCVPSGEKRARLRPQSLFICSSGVPPPAGGTETATIGLYPATSESDEPSQTLYSEPFCRYMFPPKPNIWTSEEVSIAPQAVLPQSPSSRCSSSQR